MANISSPDEFSYLEEVVAHSGPHLPDLFKPKNIKAAAKLFLLDESRFEAICTKLHHWDGRQRWRKRVENNAKRSLDNKIDEVRVKKLEGRLDAARKAGRAVLDKGRPVDIAKAFVDAARPHLAYVGGQWLDYRGTRYVEVEKGGIGAEVQHFMDTAVDINTGERFIIAPREVDHVVDALQKARFKEASAYQPPCWLDGEFEPPARVIVAANNGLLHIGSGHLMPHTPRFLNRNALPFNYDADATEPVAFLAFLESIWPEVGVSTKEAEANRQNKRTLQEVMGHLLTGETKYQKIFLFMGASRGGKGVLTRLITKLLGAANVVSLSAAKLGATFGLKGLIDKQLMVVSDFRLGRGTQNTSLIVERLLNISGEDYMSVDRKFLDDWEGKLATRIILASNMEVVFPDQAGALLNRLVVLVFKKSFADNPDLTLEERLGAELPSILNWALAGLRRLEGRVDAQGRPQGFIMPPSGEMAVRGIARQGSTVKAFLNEMCVLGRSEWIAKGVLYEVFEKWLDDSSLEDHYTEGTFAKELYAASGYSIEGEDKKRRIEGIPTPVYVGVTLASI